MLAQVKGKYGFEFIVNSTPSYSFQLGWYIVKGQIAITYSSTAVLADSISVALAYLVVTVTLTATTVVVKFWLGVIAMAFLRDEEAPDLTVGVRVSVMGIPIRL